MSVICLCELNGYQKAASSTAKYERFDLAIPRMVYCALGLVGESGEIAEKIKKYYRDDTPHSDLLPALKKELGDVLWYVSELSRQLGFKLSDVAQSNLDKLADRNARGVVGGSGDDR